MLACYKMLMESLDMETQCSIILHHQSGRLVE